MGNSRLLLRRSGGSGISSAARYVDWLVKGAKPADLPVELMESIKLAVNFKTAKVLGIKIPESIMICTDEGIR